MKKIELEITDDVYTEIKTAMSVRRLSCAAYGVLDAFIVRLIDEIDAGNDKLTLKFKEK